MTRTKILIDCDPGHDDAVAVLMAARHLDLVGITTCHGNSSVEHVTRNALSVLALAGLDIPVAAGCAAPLLGVRTAQQGVHGSTGLEGADLPPPARGPIATHAVDFLIEQARAHQGELVLAVIGPATNAALALAREPRLASWLREISVMGGSAGRGNATAVAEFNVWADPEAASVLFGCGAPIRMAGLDVTARTGAGAAEIARLREGGRVARTIADLLDFYRGRLRALRGMEIAPLHDVCAIVPYVAPDLIQTRLCHVAVELAGTLTRGMTVCDRRTLATPAAPPNVELAESADVPALLDAVVETLLAYGDGGHA